MVKKLSNTLKLIILSLFLTNNLSSCCIDNLPEHILVNVIENLDTSQDRFNILHVNKKLHTFSKKVLSRKTFHPKHQNIKLGDFQVAFIDQGYIKRVNLRNFSFELSHIKIINASTNLVHINLANIHIKSSYLKKLIKALIKHTNLSVLDIRNNNLHDKEVACLNKFLRKSNNLKYLNLDNNSIDYQGCKILKKCISSNRSLEHLSVNYNALSPKATRKLLQIMLKNNTIQSLSLNESSFDECGIKLLSRIMATNSSLKELNIEGDLTSNYKLQTAGTKLLFESLSLQYSLVTLNLNHQYIDNESVKVLCDYLENDHVLTNLYLSRNHIGIEGIEGIMFTLKTNNSLKYLDIRDNIYDYTNYVRAQKSINSLLMLKPELEILY